MSRKPLERVSLLASALALCGCSHRTSAAFQDASYRQIQIHEARLARTQQHISQMPEHDARRQPDVDALCESSRAICELSDALGESDAAERCARGRLVCRAHRAQGPGTHGGMP